MLTTSAAATGSAAWRSSLPSAAAPRPWCRLDSRLPAAAKSAPWDSTSAGWRHSAQQPPKRKLLHSALPRLRSSKTPVASSRLGTSGKPSTCQCCSRRRSAARSRPGIGSCGCAVRLAAPTGCRPTDPRSSPLVRAHEPHPGALVPIMSAARAVCRTHAAVKDQRRR